MTQRNFADYSWFNKFLLYACGALPLKKRNFLISFIRAATPVLTTWFLILPPLYTLTLRWNEFTGIERMDLAIEYFEVIFGAIKVSVLISKGEKLYRLTKSCSKLWENVNRPEDSEVVDLYAIRGLYLTYGFTTNVFAAYISLFVNPLLSKFILDTNGTILVSKQLPYPTGLFHNDVRNYNIWYVLQIPAGFVALISIVAVDTGFVFFILHACAHMRLCHQFFRNVAQDFTTEKPLATMTNEWNLKREKIFHDIVKCVTYHQDILRYSEAIEDIFAPIVLLQTLLSICTTCAFSFTLLIEDNLKKQASYLLHLIGTVLQLLLFCWPPDNLQDESTMVANAAYDLPWYDWTSKEGKLVGTIIKRSQKPSVITARRFTIISLKTFSSILSTAFSMFTLLRQVVE